MTDNNRMHRDWQRALLARLSAVAAIVVAVCVAVAAPTGGRAQDDNAAWQADLASAIAELGSEDASAVAAARDRIRAIAADGHDVGPSLRGALAGSEIGAVVEAAMLLRELGLSYDPPVVPDADGGNADANANTRADNVPAPTLPVETLRLLLKPPTTIALHQEPPPAAGQAIEVALGDPEADPEPPREVWAIVGVNEEDVTVWVERRYTMIDRVVVLMLVDAIDGAVLEAYGGHQPAPDAAADAKPRVGRLQIEESGSIAPSGFARLTTLVPANALRGSVEVPAGEFTDARTFPHTLTLRGAGADRDVAVEDTVAASVYFDALLRRRLVDSNQITRTLLRQWDDAAQTVWPE